jgi:hypothetical protein
VFGEVIRDRKRSWPHEKLLTKRETGLDLFLGRKSCSCLLFLAGHHTLFPLPRVLTSACTQILTSGPSTGPCIYSAPSVCIFYHPNKFTMHILFAFMPFSHSKHWVYFHGAWDGWTGFLSLHRNNYGIFSNDLSQPRLK